MRLILSRAKGQDLSKQFRIERSVSDVNAVILFRFNTADIRPLRDRRFAKCTIRQVGTEAQKQAARETRINILAGIIQRARGPDGAVAPETVTLPECPAALVTPEAGGTA